LPRRSPLARAVRERLRPLRGRVLSLLLERFADRAAASDWDTCRAFGARCGDLAWRLAGRDRKRSLDHLTLAFPDLTPATLHELGRKSFRHHGESLAELLYLGTRPLAHVLRFTDVTGWAHVEEANAARRPVVILTAHCGNWELLGGAFGARGVRLAAIARGLEDDALDAALVHARSHFGVETITRGSPGASRQILRALRPDGEARALALLIDQDTPVDGVWAPFFGRLAYTPSAAWSLARRFAAVLLPAFMVRHPGGRHELIVDPPFEVAAEAEVAVAAMNRRIEAQIRAHPEQWVWMHRRWRRQPPTGEGPAG
jgi:KDO2-lipid IV(A) lauroyltransferase